MTAQPKPRCGPADRAELDQIQHEASQSSGGELSHRVFDALVDHLFGAPDVDRIGPSNGITVCPVRVWDALRDLRTRVEQLERSEVDASWDAPMPNGCLPPTDAEGAALEVGDDVYYPEGDTLIVSRITQFVEQSDGTFVVLRQGTTVWLTGPTADIRRRPRAGRLVSPKKDAKPKTRSIRSGATGHRYELDGEKCPGVTTIIKEAVPMPALVGWAGRTVAEYVMERLAKRGDDILADELLADLRAFNETRKYPEKLGAPGTFSRIGLTKVLSQVQYAERDAAANRGTEVHTLAQRLSAGEEIEVPEALTGHVDSYLRFLEEWQPTDAILEGVVINRKWRYMGRFDLIATLPRLGRTLLDIKTSRTGPYGEAALQLAAYRYAETILDDDAEVPMPPVESTAILHVRADGYDLYPFEAGEGAFRIFLYCKQVAAAIDRDHGFIGNARGEALEVPAREEAAS